MSCAALTKLSDAVARTGVALSVGLEPAERYLPEGFGRTIYDHERFMRLVIEATADLVPAFKFNLAFFESLGSEGWAMLERLRDDVPGDVLLIADAKRGDIGTTAEHYAKSVFDHLQMDSVTLSPLMGHDSARPFLAYEDRLSFFLVLTSNPGANDFLLRDGLHLNIAKTVAGWNTAGNCGFVVGATQPAHAAEIRAAAPGVPFLVPGVGAQGGDAAALASAARDEATDWGGLLFHITRGILPSDGDHRDPLYVIRDKTKAYAKLIKDAVGEAAAR